MTRAIAARGHAADQIINQGKVKRGRNSIETLKGQGEVRGKGERVSNFERYRLGLIHSCKHSRALHRDDFSPMTFHISPKPK